MTEVHILIVDETHLMSFPISEYDNLIPSYRMLSGQEPSETEALSNWPDAYHIAVL